MSASEFIVCYLSDCVKMAYRELIKKVDEGKEDQLISNLYSLLDLYSEGELREKIYLNKIV